VEVAVECKPTAIIVKVGSITSSDKYNAPEFIASDKFTGYVA
jgi:hypothetical protein